MEVQQRKVDFVHFDLSSPIFLLSKMGVICLSIIESFCFICNYMKAELQNKGKIALAEKNGNFLHELTKFEKTDCQIKPNLFILLDTKMIQRRCARIFEFFIFSILRDCKVKNFWNFWQNLKLQNNENFENSHILFCITLNLPIWTNLA